MKPEQLDKLERLQDKLLTVAVDDCDPENWTGYGQKPRDMDRETRGNAIYDRKLAGQTLACLVRVGNIIDTHTKPTQGNTKSDEDIADLVAEAEKTGNELLKEIEARHVKH